MKNNARETLQVAQVEQFQLLELETGFELRRLPCDHVYCRTCIEPWLAERSTKCPDLSCFWYKEGENGDDDSGENDNDNGDVATTTSEIPNPAQPPLVPLFNNDTSTINNLVAPAELASRAMSDHLWPVQDAESFLGASPAQGGLSCCIILERLVEVAQIGLTEEQQANNPVDEDLTERLGQLWNDMEQQAVIDAMTQEERDQVQRHDA